MWLKKNLGLLLSFALIVSIVLPAGVFADESTNLIANPSAEINLDGQPINWTKNSWGSNTPTFDYTTNSHTGARSLSVSITNYVDGDAKWMADQAAVTGGKTYTYSDYSMSNVETELDAAYVNASGEMSFVYLQSIPASSSWQPVISTFTVPADAVSVSIYHILFSNGTLHIDDAKLTDQGQSVPPTQPTDSSVNLLANSSFETADGDNPANWQRGGWGVNNATLSHTNNDAHTGSRSAQVTISSFTSGDSKWYATPISVAAGSYVYEDFYHSNVSTRVVVAMTDKSGVDTYTELAAAPASDSWIAYKGKFTVGSNVRSIAVYHLLDKVGNLSIDDVSITSDTPVQTPPSTPEGYIINPSFEAANGSQPASWSGDKWGTNTATFSYLQNDAHSGTSSAKVTITNYSSGDAKWSFAPITTLTPGAQYNFSAWYKSNTDAHVVMAYVDANGTDKYLTLPNPLGGADAATTWQSYTTKLNIPADAVSVTIYFLISSNGWLQTDDFSLTPSVPIGFDSPLVSLTFDDGWSSIYSNGLPVLQKYGMTSTQYILSGKLNTEGYMTTAMVNAFQSAGHEIGSHTITHPNLTLLSESNATNELSNSQATLRQLFVPASIQSFASPYGSYNASTLGLIQQYYQSHRSTDVGFNTKDNFNPYNILVQNVERDTTLAEVTAWVTKAKAESAWLVLVYHAVTDAADADEYSVSPSALDAQLDAINSSGVPVKTVGEALTIIRNQL